MRRSKTLLVSNVLATVYSIVLLFIFGSRIIEAGGIEYIETVGASFELLFDIAEAIDIGLPIVTFVYVIFCCFFNCNPKIIFRIGMHFTFT